jgi:hypothetical protein
MKQILCRLINRCGLVYVDDILIFGASIDVMVANLDAALARISHEEGSIDLGKSKLLAEEKDFLGHTFGKSGLNATNKDISTIREYKKSTSKKEMWNFLGLAKYEIKCVLTLLYYTPFPKKACLREE